MQWSFATPWGGRAFRKRGFTVEQTLLKKTFSEVATPPPPAPEVDPGRQRGPLIVSRRGRVDAELSRGTERGGGTRPAEPRATRPGSRAAETPTTAPNRAAPTAALPTDPTRPATPGSLRPPRRPGRPTRETLTGQEQPTIQGSSPRKKVAQSRARLRAALARRKGQFLRSLHPKGRTPPPRTRRLAAPSLARARQAFRSMIDKKIAGAPLRTPVAPAPAGSSPIRPALSTPSRGTAPRSARVPDGRRGEAASGRPKTAAPLAPPPLRAHSVFRSAALFQSSPLLTGQDLILRSDGQVQVAPSARSGGATRQGWFTAPRVLQRRSGWEQAATPTRTLRWVAGRFRGMVLGSELRLLKETARPEEARALPTAEAPSGKTRTAPSAGARSPARSGQAGTTGDGPAKPGAARPGARPIPQAGASRAGSPADTLDFTWTEGQTDAPPPATEALQEVIGALQAGGELRGQARPVGGSQPLSGASPAAGRSPQVRKILRELRTLLRRSRAPGRRGGRRAVRVELRWTGSRQGGRFRPVVVRTEQTLVRDVTRAGGSEARGPRVSGGMPEMDIGSPAPSAGATARWDRPEDVRFSFLSPAEPAPTGRAGRGSPLGAGPVLGRGSASLPIPGSRPRQRVIGGTETLLSRSAVRHLVDQRPPPAPAATPAPRPAPPPAPERTPMPRVAPGEKLTWTPKGFERTPAAPPGGSSPTAPPRPVAGKAVKKVKWDGKRWVEEQPVTPVAENPSRRAEATKGPPPSPPPREGKHTWDGKSWVPVKQDKDRYWWDGRRWQAQTRKAPSKAPPSQLPPREGELLEVLRDLTTSSDEARVLMTEIRRQLDLLRNTWKNRQP